MTLVWHLPYLPYLFPRHWRQGNGKLGMKAGLGPGYIVLDGNPATPQKARSLQFSAYVCCGQMVANLMYC